MHSTEIDNWESAELYYHSLASIYITAYEDYTKRSKRILTAMGVIVSMHSELLLYRSKNASNEKARNQEQRLSLLEDIISEFSVIADRNYQMKFLLQQRDKEIEDLTSENESLKLEIEIKNQILEAE